MTAEPREGIETRSNVDRGKALRCNAQETRPQRIPKFTASAWGSLRVPTGWSLRELAERTGINAGELSRIERGRSCPTPDQARRILAAYGEAE